MHVTSTPTFSTEEVTKKLQEGHFLPSLESLLLPSDFYGGQEMMLSLDKIVSCEAFSHEKSNVSTPAATFGFTTPTSVHGDVLTGSVTPPTSMSTIHNRPGASIVSPIVLSVAGISGHILALYYLHRSTAPSHSRTVFYVLLTTLIWTDLIGKLITTPQAIVSYAYGRWVGGPKLCNFHGYCMILIDFVTHSLISTMALDRFICVKYCYFYKSKITKSRARTHLMSMWLFALVFCALPLFGIGEFENQYPGTWCFINIHVNSHTPWYHRVYTNLFGLMTVINIFVICICNIMVIGTLLSARFQRSRKLSASLLPTQRRNSTQRELEIQMSIVLLVITVVFLVSWSPLDIRLFLNQIWPHTCREEHISDLVAIRLVSINQIIDPWAYIICRRVFTSSGWKYCRSAIIGRTCSTKKAIRHSITLQMPHNHLAKGKHNETSFPSKQKRSSLPTLERVQMVSLDSVQHVSEMEGCLGSRGLKTITRDKRRSGKSPKNVPCKGEDLEGRFLDRGTQCVCRKYGVCEESSGIKDEFSRSSSTKVEREQFRVPASKKDVPHIRYSRRLSSKRSSRSYTFTPFEDSRTESDDGIRRKEVLTGRRHSWGCTPSAYKQFMSRSTQTLENQI